MNNLITYALFINIYILMDKAKEREYKGEQIFKEKIDKIVIN